MEWNVENTLAVVKSTTLRKKQTSSPATEKRMIKININFLVNRQELKSEAISRISLFLIKSERKLKNRFTLDPQSIFFNFTKTERGFCKTQISLLSDVILILISKARIFMLLSPLGRNFISMLTRFLKEIKEEQIERMLWFTFHSLRNGFSDFMDYKILFFKCSKFTKSTKYYKSQQLLLKIILTKFLLK